MNKAVDIGNNFLFLKIIHYHNEDKIYKICRPIMR